jgi:hypothetical protein
MLREENEARRVIREEEIKKAREYEKALKARECEEAKKAREYEEGRKAREEEQARIAREYEEDIKAYEKERTSGTPVEQQETYATALKSKSPEVSTKAEGGTTTNIEIPEALPKPRVKLPIQRGI